MKSYIARKIAAAGVARGLDITTQDRGADGTSVVCRSMRDFVRACLYLAQDRENTIPSDFHEDHDLQHERTTQELLDTLARMVHSLDYAEAVEKQKLAEIRHEFV